MRIGSAAWRDAHPDAPTRAEAEEDAQGPSVIDPDVAALVSERIAYSIDDAVPEHELWSCPCTECDQIRAEEAAEQAADGRRDDAVS